MSERSRAVRVIADGLRPHAGGAAGRMRRLAVRDWAVPIAVANEHLVGPAYYAALRTASVLDELPEDVRAYLALLHGANLGRNAALRAQMAELLQALASAGIEPMVLKGARVLAVGLYDDPGVRMFRDLDVAVRRERIPDAQSILASLGYTVATVYPPELNAVAEYTRPGDPGAVDLHREIVDVPHLLSAAETWDRSVMVSIDNVRCRVPSPTDAMLHHLVHAQIHFRGAFYWGAVELRQLHEFVALARHGGAAIDWGFIRTRLAQYGLRPALESYALAAAHWLEAAWPLPWQPSPVARFHAWRCSVQLRWPRLQALLAPWANLRAAFASHRMGARYPRIRSATLRRIRHLAQYLRKTTATGLARRFFLPRF